MIGNPISKKLLIMVIIVIGVAILAVLIFRQNAKPAMLATETTTHIGKKFTAGFDFTQEEKSKAKPLYAKLRSGGPAKDGIPSLDNPKFVAAQDATFLKENDLVLGFFYKGQARAYPLRILNWHEIVNDKVAGDAVLISYCPLCFTGIAFSRNIDGQDVEFGTSGKLINSNLVMYDRATNSLWTQLGGEAIIGKAVGKKLTQLPADTVTWADWKKVHPEAIVLSTDTGFSRNYDANPYEGYGESLDTFGTAFADSRLHPKAKVAGIEIEGKFKAYSEELLEQKGKLVDNFAGVILEITKDQAGGVSFINQKTAGEIVPTISYWFAWVSFHPDTELLK